MAGLGSIGLKYNLKNYTQSRFLHQRFHEVQAVLCNLFNYTLKLSPAIILLKEVMVYRGQKPFVP